MSPIQQLFLGGGPAVTKPYIESLFGTHLYKGTAAAKTITNGIKLGTDGGIVITKNRDSSSNWAWGSPIAAIGTGKYNISNAMNLNTTDANSYTAFNNNGYTIGSTSVLNASNEDFVSYSFKKTPGFVDVISYVGNGAASRVLSHDLGSVPGWIAIVCTTKSENKTTWHRGFGDRVSGSASEYYAFLDGGNNARNSSAAYPALPTATQLTIGSYVNISGETYVAYIFGGGESPAALARSVEFSGSTSTLSLGSSPDFNFGTGDFTIEAWCYRNGGFYTIFDHLMGSDHFIIFSYTDSPIQIYSNPGGGHLTSGVNPGNKKWFHLAVVRESGKLKFYIDGVKAGATHNFTLDIPQAGVVIGRAQSGGQTLGRISNLRVVKGTAVYTSDFKPSTTPLTNITNTKLLCCNNSSTTGSTVAPGTITANGSVTASSDSPFLDPAGFVFGEDENESVIATGSYQGNGSATGPEIYLGWEPQLLLFKNATSGYDWRVFDSMRGIVSDANDVQLSLNATAAESDFNSLELTSTGFKITTTNGAVNNNNDRIAYIAIRRPDGYVGKPAKAGTDVFTVVAGLNTPNNPNYVTNFVTDMSLWKLYESTGDWWQAARLTGQKYLSPNNTNAENTNTNYKWDYMNGWYVGPYTLSTQMGWHFKRHAGFTTVTYKGDGVAGRKIPHDMNNSVGMIWTKKRSSAAGWRVWHQGLNGGGSNAATYYLSLNETTAQTSNGDIYGSSSGILPTSTHWTVGSNAAVNENGSNFTAMLFSSIPGISKCGSYNGSDSAQTITTGFQPRFVMIKKANISGTNWVVMDTTRGWGSGTDKWLRLDHNGAQITYDLGEPTSTGFTLVGGSPTNSNISGAQFIYFAHA